MGAEDSEKQHRQRTVCTPSCDHNVANVAGIDAVRETSMRLRFIYDNRG